MKEFYSTNLSASPSKLIQPSVKSADRLWNDWLRVNNYREITDKDGLIWQLHILDQELPDPISDKTIWKIVLKITTEATAADLIKTGTLDPIADARMAGLIGEAKIPFVLKPHTFTANKLEDARVQLRDLIPNLQHKLNGAVDLHSIKRKTVVKWIELSRQFGANVK